MDGGNVYNILDGRSHGNIGIDERITLKWILNK
jgi:hypothetical protein